MTHYLMHILNWLCMQGAHAGRALQLFGIFMVLLPMSAWATCYKISHNPGQYNTPSSQYYIDPAYGTPGVWDGANDSVGTRGGLPAVINLNSLAFQPEGTLIASGSDSFLNSGASPYVPDQVLFRCTANEAGNLYEYYATNGDSDYGGRYNDGAVVGLDEVYRTRFLGMGIRVKNTITGEYYSRFWKVRTLTGLTVDSQGWILVKAKDFSSYSVELIRLDNQNGWTTSGIYSHSQPSAYIAFQGGGISQNLSQGADSNSQFDGWYSVWPGAVNLYNKLTVRRSATCSVTSVTPNVIFPTVSANGLNSGEIRQLPISIQFACQTDSPSNIGLDGFASGTAVNQTAIGVLVNPANAAAAVSEGVGVAGAGVGYLLSDGYGTDPSISTGVGIQLSRIDGTPLNFLSNLGALGGGGSAGWYPVLDDANSLLIQNGVTSYTKTWMATLKALPSKVASVGKIRAQAHVIIKVQ
jgi:type 1 fimbria pilin